MPAASLEEWFAVNELFVRYASQVPELLGLPAISGNLAEGYVLKPAGQVATTKRPAVKRKIAEFDELRFDESSAFDANALPSLQELLVFARQFMNTARLASARSKVGEDAQQVVDEAVLDAMIDLRSALPRCIDSLSAAQEQELQAQLEARARKLV